MLPQDRASRLVHLTNLLTTEPRPRNRALADAMKRIGVVERSGRDVDTNYRGMLKFGHPAPDYGRTEAGLVDAHGTTRGRSYTLSVSVCRAAGDKAGYTRQAGFAALQHEQMVMNYVRQHGQIRRAEAMELYRLSEDQAKKLLLRLRDEGQLIQHEEQRGTHYTSGTKV